jgi:hypothetical protein
MPMRKLPRWSSNLFKVRCGWAKRRPLRSNPASRLVLQGDRLDDRESATPLWANAVLAGLVPAACAVIRSTNDFSTQAVAVSPVEPVQTASLPPAPAVSEYVRPTVLPQELAGQDELFARLGSPAELFALPEEEPTEPELVAPDLVADLTAVDGSGDPGPSLSNTPSLDPAAAGDGVAANEAAGGAAGGASAAPPSTGSPSLGNLGNTAPGSPSRTGSPSQSPPPAAAVPPPAAVPPASSGSTTSPSTTSNPSGGGTPLSAGGVVSATGLNVFGSLGTPLTNVAFASFSDSNPTSEASDFLATIDFGSGPVYGTVVSDGSGGYQVQGSHTWNVAGRQTATVSITDVLDYNSSRVTSHITISQVPLQVDAIPVQAIAGQPFTAVVAGYGPSQPQSPPTATIDWGDGTSSDGFVSQTAIRGTHTYTQQGDFTITVTASGDGGSASATSTAMVTLGPGQGSGVALQEVEGQPFGATLGTVTLPVGLPVGVVQTSLDWGDGSGPVPGSLSSDGHGHYLVLGAHSYDEEGVFTLTITLSAHTPDFQFDLTFTSTVLVAGAALNGAGPPLSLVEGTTYNGPVASFTDANSVSGDGYAAVIDWGDGQLSPGTVQAGTSPGTFVVNGTHVYAEEGTDLLQVTVEDEGDSKRVLPPSVVTVNDAPLTLIPATLSGNVENFPIIWNLGAISEGAYDLPGEFQVSVDWGDGTSSTIDPSAPVPFGPQDGFVNAPQGAIPIRGLHSYSATGTFTIVVTVTDQDGSVATLSDSVTIGENPGSGAPPYPYLSVTGQDFSTQEGSNNPVVVATFVDTLSSDSSPDSYMAQINWGDGTSPTTVYSGGLGVNTITYANGVWSVQAVHAYASDGTYPVSVQVSDTDNDFPDPPPVTPFSPWVPASASASVSEVPIRNVALQVQPAAPLQLSEGDSLNNVTVATFTSAWPVPPTSRPASPGETTAPLNPASSADPTATGSIPSAARGPMASKATTPSPWWSATCRRRNPPRALGWSGWPVPAS